MNNLALIVLKKFAKLNNMPVEVIEFDHTFPSMSEGINGRKHGQIVQVYRLKCQGHSIDVDFEGRPCSDGDIEALSLMGITQS